MPYRDSWDIVPLLQKLNNGTLGFTDLWAQHNEHRILFPNIVLLVLAKITHWYTPADIAASVIIGALGFLLIVDLMKRSSNMNKKLLYLCSILFVSSAWYFSPIQWENWLWGWQLEWFMCITSAIASLYFIFRFSEKQKKRFFILALISSTITMYSLGSGSIIWLVGLGSLIALRNIDRKYMYTWVATALLEIFFYYRSYVKPSDSPSLKDGLEKPVFLLHYFLTALGRPFTANQKIALIAGVILFIFLIILIFTSMKMHKSNKNILIVWYGIIAYGVLGLAATSFSRLGFGIGTAMNSKYTAFSLLIIVGMLGLFMVIFNSRKISTTHSIIFVAFILLNLVLLSFSYRLGIKEMYARNSVLTDLRKCISLPRPSRMCAYVTYPPSESIIRERINYIKTHHYAGF